MIKRRALALSCALVLAAPVAAAPGGAMWTAAQGRWNCELPGDAATAPTPQPVHNFSIVPDSSYIAATTGKRGAYLLLNNQLTMTTGPFAGHRFVRAGGATLIRLGADGQRLLLRCVRAGAVRDDFSAVPSAADATGVASAP
jgi:hypothetical protein